MTDLTNPKWMWLKGALLLGIGVIAVALLLAERCTWKTAILLALIIWSFCRAYYFAFYVIEHYVDREYKFAGLLSFLRYAIQKRRPAKTATDRQRNGHN